VKTIPINLEKKLELFSDFWVPKIIGQMNDYHVKLAKVNGEFVWHDHPKTDELFLVIKGSLTIHLRDGVVMLNKGDMFIVPKGVEHKPVAEDECHILLIEPVGTVNTGTVIDSNTASNNEWI